MELSQRFQDLIQDLRDHDEEQMKIKLRESMAQRNAEFSQKEKVRVVCVRVCVFFWLILFVMLFMFFTIVSTSMFIIIRKVCCYRSYLSPYSCLLHDCLSFY